MRLALIAAGMALVWAGPGGAQQAVDNSFAFRPGDRVRVVSRVNAHPPNTFEIRSCENVGVPARSACDVFWVELNKAIYVTWSSYKPEDYALTLLARGPAAAKPAQARPATPRPTAQAPTPATTAAATQCPAKLPSQAKAPAFNAATARWAIAEDYYLRARPNGITSPASVGVSFESLTLGGSEPNVVLNDPGRGAYLKNDAAPRGATLYSVQSVYRVCDVYSSGVRIARYRARHVCFKGKTGEWGCGVDGFPQRETVQ